jgi:hypothetical protein
MVVIALYRFMKSMLVRNPTPLCWVRAEHHIEGETLKITKFVTLAAMLMALLVAAESMAFARGMVKS